MRAAIDARYAGIRPSGIGRYTEALLARLPGLASPDVIEAWMHPRVATTGVPPNLVRCAVASEPNHVPTLLWPAALARLEHVDVFHAPFNVLGRGIPCATVATIHDLMWLERPELCQSLPLLRWVQRKFFGAGLESALRADRIITPSRSTADAILARVPAAPVSVIPHGVERGWAPPADREAARARAVALGLDAPFFLAVGQGAPYKNHAAIVAAHAAADLGGVELALVERLERLERRRIPGARVVSFATLPEEDLRALVQTALALVQFSRAEGFGLPVLEAMACGTPVIVSDVPALREIAGDAALVVPTIEALAAAMKRLTREPSLRAELAERGLERARSFDWDEAAKAHLEIYREAAETPRAQLQKNSPCRQ